ncbi:hypothetical protein AND_008084 [Anopheles darlingi]|uniref:G-protein coupled receptors family 1 profile domain-containing protein n=1 Tax=Anopheles darlingi TaxID=43151 RepID=W5J766_ANODA|nr:hypothetical protein AND_008084 [Anopheles darlingi]
MDLFDAGESGLEPNPLLEYNHSIGDGGNGSQNGSIPLYTGYPRLLLNFATVTCIAYMVIGVPGNLLTIVALIKSKKVRTE